MAQSEDTELRDLVIDALEKNGSLAKVRALLRANIFLAFEEEYDNVTHNTYLDNILQIPEGLLSLSLVHEFLEYCNLRNTKFVYVSETRQGKDYKYEGRRSLLEKLSHVKSDLAPEPLLVSIIKSIFDSQNKHTFGQGDHRSGSLRTMKNGMKGDQNCTYIVHEDSSSVSSNSQSQSDNSSDEKHKLKLHLDNSDTDTSSDSTRDKSSSEYIANENIIIDAGSDDDSRKSIITQLRIENDTKVTSKVHDNHPDTFTPTSAQNKLNDTIYPAYISSDSTSYLEIQNSHFHQRNTDKVRNCEDTVNSNKTNSSSDVSKNSISAVHSNFSPNNGIKAASQDVYKSVAQNQDSKKSPEENIAKSEIVTSDYSYDFSPSPQSLKELDEDIEHQNSLDVNRVVLDSPKQHSYSSRSSVSISDVADLIENSELNSPVTQHKISYDRQMLNKSESVGNEKDIFTYNIKSNNTKSPRDISEEYSGSSIPSLSNLSLDLNSD